jgi:hypothetical protein
MTEITLEAIVKRLEAVEKKLAEDQRSKTVLPLCEAEDNSEVECWIVCRDGAPQDDESNRTNGGSQ